MKCILGLCECPDPAMPKWLADECQCEHHLFDYPHGDWAEIVP